MQLEHPVPALRCSERSLLDGEQLAGTAPENAGWLLIEQPPPWGREALLESRIDGAIAQELSARANAAGVKVLLIRLRRTRPGIGAGRRVLAASVGLTPFVQELRLAREEHLVDLDLGRLAGGTRLDGGTNVVGQVTLVCTNGRRDACCALLGCAAADALAAARPGRIWECSHVGGHRFAPTILSFPTGACFGRLEPAAAVSAIAALERGQLDLEHLRGIVGRPQPVQVADAILRRRRGLTRLDDLRLVSRHELDDEVEVRFADRTGAEHVVRVRRRPAPSAPASCGGAPEPRVHWEPVQAT